MDNKILEYQKLDIKLNKIKREISTQSNSGAAQELINQVKQWQSKVLALEEDAKRLMAELNKLIEVQKKGVALVDKYAKVDIQKLSDAELKDFDVKTMQTANQLAELDSRIEKHTLQVKKVVLDYEMYRKKIIAAKQKREEQKQNMETITSQKAPDVEQIKAQLLALEKSIDAPMLAKYKTLKQDGVFPVLVALVDNRCGGCRMQLSAGALDKLKNNGKLECEQCRRIIYLDK